MATLRQLKAFIAAAEYRKMSEAAKHLYISQPTVSQIISDLEREYNTRLFERHAKELHITPAGTLLLQSAREIIAIHENLEQNMKYINSVRPLRIGATVTIGNNLIGELMKQLEERHSDIDTFVYVNNTQHIEEMLVQNELDIALVEGIISREEILTTPVLEDNLCLICSRQHPFASSESVLMEELKNEKFILREKGSGTRAIFENIMRTHHIPYQVKWESSSPKAIVDAVRRNYGLGFLSDRCITTELANEEICLCRLPEISLKRFFYISYNNCHPVTTQMQDFIYLVRTQPEALALLRL